MNKELIIEPTMSLIDALKVMDRVDRKLLILSEGNTFIGVISIGDIQRALINKVDLSVSVMSQMRTDVLFANDTDNLEYIKGVMKKERIECMPVVNANNELIDIIEWSDVFNCKKGKRYISAEYPVVIMAGGKGQRLSPLTNIIPKPLIPISEKTIIEEIMDRFVNINCSEFYLSVNYKADDIKEYFEKHTNSKYKIKFFQEDYPLGTAGSLYLIKDSIRDTFFVSNCDILVDVDYSDLLDYHKKNHNVATIVSVLKNYKIPYGTLETKENGLLTSLNEKPTITYQINSGLYVLEPEVFNYMNSGEFVHMTELFSRLIADEKNVGVFPVSEGSWVDMGNWEEYLKIVKKE